jgi:hypothetical protein
VRSWVQSPLSKKKGRKEGRGKEAGRKAASVVASLLLLRRGITKHSNFKLHLF